MLNVFFLLARHFFSPAILHTAFIQYTATLYNDTTSSPPPSHRLFHSLCFQQLILLLNSFCPFYYYCLLYSFFSLAAINV